MKTKAFAILDGDGEITESNNGQLNIFSTKKAASKELKGPIATNVDDLSGFKILPIVVLPSGKFKVNIAWDRESSDYASEHGFRAARKNKRLNTSVEEFETEEERSAFMKGMEDGNGWDDPFYETAEQTKEFENSPLFK